MGFISSMLFRQFWKRASFQPFFQRLFNWALWSMNYGGGGELRTSGEYWFIGTFLPTYVNSASAYTPIIMDVGANIGMYSRAICESIPEARVYAFEPCTVTFDQLQDNLKELTNVEPIKLGLSDTTQTVTIYNYSFNGRSADVLASLVKRLPTQHGQIEVESEEEIEVITIDEFCSRNQITKVDLLKLDIEGYELRALDGAKKSLQDGVIDIIQFEFGPANLYAKTTFYDFWVLLSPHYDLYRLLPASLFRIPYYEEQLEVYLTTNYVAIRRQEG